MFVGFQNVSTSSMRNRHTHGQTGEKKIPSDSTTETKWRLWEPSYVYSIGLLYFSSHCFEDCFNVRGGFNVVLPSGHYFPVCHAEERWEIKNWELQRVTVHKLLVFHAQWSIDGIKKDFFILGSEIVHLSWHQFCLNIHNNVLQLRLPVSNISISFPEVNKWGSLRNWFSCRSTTKLILSRFLPHLCAQLAN